MMCQIHAYPCIRTFDFVKYVDIKRSGMNTSLTGVVVCPQIEDKHLAVISRVLGGLEIARKSSLPGRRRLLCVSFLSYISFYAHINTIRQSGLTFGRLPQTDFPCTT